MRAADLGVDLPISEVLKEHGIEDLYPPLERAVPIGLDGLGPKALNRWVAIHMY